MPSQPTAKLFPDFERSLEMPPGFYSGDRPNETMHRFVLEQGTEYDGDSDDYAVTAFNKAIKSTKATAIYNMHVYWSKKPHGAIREYIRHYTSEGELVLDPFCGSGGTATSALMEGRRAIAIDRSPAATFITKNYVTPVSPSEIDAALEQIKAAIEEDMRWLYGTVCDRCDGQAVTGYTVYSNLYTCERCLSEVPLYDAIEAQVVAANGNKRQ